MSGGIRTSVKGYLNAQRTSLALDPVHENVTINSNVTTAQDPVEETTMDSTKYGLSICDGNIPCLPVLTAKNLASQGTRSTESPPYQGYRHYQRKRNARKSPEDTSEENNFLENLFGMPIRYSYKDLKTATNNFSNEIGRGAFGSVYLGVLPDGTRLAVKKSESISFEVKEEFQAEGSVSGSIHHLHLVRLRGFCVKGSNRFLVYEYMANGSLDKWIFTNEAEFVLDWRTRFNIAVGIAKGLAYLHEDCDLKIIHCDIKAQNVLLDDCYRAKVSDFGLAVLMTREQDSVSTSIRGTKGYVAPEWFKNYPITEKIDVYSYGILLLEIIGGRRNFDPSLTTEKQIFNDYAFEMLNEGKLEEIFDSKMRIGDVERVSTAVMVAFCCIQEDATLRPPMTKVVQMLQGSCSVPRPPTSSRFYDSMLHGGTSSGRSDCNTDAYLSGESAFPALADLFID